MAEKNEILTAIYNELKRTGAVRNKADFAQKLEYNYTSLSQAFAGNRSYLSHSLFENILQKFPQVSRDFILSGNGTPLLDGGVSYSLSPSSSPSSPQPAPQEGTQLNDLLPIVIAQQKSIQSALDQAAKAQEQVSRLISIIEKHFSKSEE